MASWLVDLGTGRVGALLRRRARPKRQGRPFDRLDVDGPLDALDQADLRPLDSETTNNNPEKEP